MYQYQFKNGAFEVPENAEIMITSFQIPYSWYNISSHQKKIVLGTTVTDRGDTEKF